MAGTRLERRVERREERAQQIAQQRAAFRKRERNKRVINIAIVVIVVLAIAYGAWVLLQTRSGKYDALAKCLTQKGAIMYGTDWCPHCQEQKREFGDSFRYVTYINCDANPDACAAAGVKGFPTWNFARGLPNEGVMSLDALAQRNGCTLQ